MRVFREHIPRVKSMISQIIQLDKVLNGSGGGWGGGGGLHSSEAQL